VIAPGGRPALAIEGVQELAVALALHVAPLQRPGHEAERARDLDEGAKGGQAAIDGGDRAAAPTEVGAVGQRQAVGGAVSMGEQQRCRVGDGRDAGVATDVLQVSTVGAQCLRAPASEEGGQERVAGGEGLGLELWTRGGHGPRRRRILIVHGVHGTLRPRGVRSAPRSFGLENVT
jgi:hypothetical protein